MGVDGLGKKKGNNPYNHSCPSYQTNKAYSQITLVVYGYFVVTLTSTTERNSRTTRDDVAAHLNAESIWW